MADTYAWEFGSVESGLKFNVVFDAVTRMFTVTVEYGALNVNALYWSDGNSTDSAATGLSGFSGAKSESSLNMNGSGVTWDGGMKLSDAGLTQTPPPSYIDAYANTSTPNSYSIAAPSDFNPDVFSTLGVRATSTSTPGGSIKAVDSDPRLPPVFDSTAGTVNFVENGTGVAFNGHATDPDSQDTLTYSISGADKDLFNINTATGEVTFKSPPNFEGQGDNSYDIVITVNDGFFTVNKPLTINVTDVNEAPTLTVDASPVSVVEKSTDTTTVIADVDGTDPDVGGGNDGPTGNGYDQLVYSIESGNVGGAFTIDATTGEVRLASGATLDYETLSTYTLGVRVTDGGGEYDDKTVTINVTDVNEAPTLTVDASPVSVVEKSTDTTTVIADVDGTDPDVGGGNDGPTGNGYDQLVYSIESGNVGGAFTIDATTGEVRLASGATLDYETLSTYTLGVRVTDGGGEYDDKTVTINVTDVNEAPTLTVDASPVSVVEKSTDTTTVIADVDGTDPDVGGGNDGPTGNGYDQLVYSIESGNVGGAFTIDATTGEVRLASGATLDYETLSTYTLGVRVTDGGGEYDDKTVTINVTDVNEAPTLTVDASPVSVVEKSTDTTTVIADVDGTDPDVGGGNDGPTGNGYDQLVYSIESGNVGGAFTIDATTGEIRLASGATLDYETLSTYTLGVRVTDGGGEYDDKTVTINVTDLNEKPTLTVDASPVSVVEMSTDTTTVIADVDGTDPDVGGGNDGPTGNGYDQLVYSIESGNVGGAFTIDATTGEIRLASGATLDYETLSTYTLGVRVTDGGGEYDDKTVTINVTDLNEKPEAGSDIQVSFYEDVADTVTLADVNGTDPDAGGGNDNDNTFENLTYSIASGNTDGLFEIDPATGVVSLAAGKSLDYETTTQHVLTVEVKDGPGLTDTLKVTIDVLDRDEAPPPPTDLGGPTGLDFVPNQTGNNPGLGQFVQLGNPDLLDKFTFSYTATSNTTLPASNVSVSSGGQLSAAQDNNVVGDYTVVVTVTDQANNQFVASYHLVVGQNGNTDNTLNGGTGSDILAGENGQDTLNGSSGRDYLIGGTQIDTLNGGLGNDVLFGGDGSKDIFVFDTALGSTNVDAILDFNANTQDTINLENSIFTSLATTGTLSANNFAANSGGTAQDANDFVLYDTTTGGLFYDADGNGAGVKVQFATLTLTGLSGTVDSGDFVVV